MTALNDKGRRRLGSVAALLITMGSFGCSSDFADTSEVGQVSTPLCETPAEIDYASPHFGISAARLNWNPFTGECGLDKGARTREDFAGLLQFSTDDEGSTIHAVGLWRYQLEGSLAELTATELNAMDLDREMTLFPKYGDWRFQVDLELHEDSVTLLDFEQLEGIGEDHGVAERRRSGDELAAAGLVSEGDDEEDGVGQVKQAQTQHGDVPHNVDVDTPPGTGIDDFILVSQERMDIREGAVIPAPIANMGDGPTVIYSSASVTDIYSKGLVDLRSGANVSGSIYTTQDEIVQGSANYNPALVDTNFVFEPPNETVLNYPIPPAGDFVQDIFLDAGGTATADMSPGTYDSVHLQPNTTATLEPGVYYFNSLQVEPDAEMVIDVSSCGGSCVVVINVVVQVIPPLRGDFITSNGSDPNLLLNYFGNALVEIDTAWNGFIIAQDAKLLLNNFDHKGSFFANEIEVRSGPTLTHRPFSAATYQL